MTFIIAEIGSNHGGDLSAAKRCIEKASFARASAAKFQLFSWKDLYGEMAEDKENKASIKVEWLPELKKTADDCGIEFMCSAFSVNGLQQLEPFVARHKLASPEKNHPHMLQELKRQGKPVIASCGAACMRDIHFIINSLEGIDLTLLYCVSAYPTADVRLEKIVALKKAFPDTSIGLSDHSLDSTCAPVVAVTHFGATVIEKHFNPLGLTDTPDACVSLSFKQFMVMTSRIRRNPDAIPVYEPDDVEFTARACYNRRIVATREIKSGDFFGPDNIGIYRAILPQAYYTNPMEYDDLIGKFASRDYSIGASIQD